MNNSSSSHDDILQANRSVRDDYSCDHDSIASHITKPSCVDDYKARLDHILDLNHKEYEHSNILELGCGTGNWAEHFVCRNVKSYTGIDISEGMIAVAERKIPRSKANFICSSIEDFSKQCFDLYDIIFSFSFIHHMYDLGDFFNNISKWLKPGGIYIGYTNL